MCKINQDRIDNWKIKYKENKRSINNIYQFAVDNIETYRCFNKMTIRNLIEPFKDISEIIYFTFLDCINASGGNNLTNTFKSCEKVLNYSKKFKNCKSLNFEDFMTGFGYNGDDDLNKFFLYFVGKNNKELNFPNFKEKKAALFFKELDCINKEREIFRNYNYKELKYTIALDIVIEDLFNLMLKYENKYYENRKSENDKIKWKKCEDIINSETGKDFCNFNKFIEEIKLDKEVVESFWFWGYFNTTNKNDANNDNKELNKEQNNTKPNFRRVKFNKAKYYTNKFFYPSEDNRYYEVLNKFSKLFNNKIYNEK